MRRRPWWSQNHPDWQFPFTIISFLIHFPISNLSFSIRLDSNKLQSTDTRFLSFALRTALDFISQEDHQVTMQYNTLAKPSKLKSKILLRQLVIIRRIVNALITGNNQSRQRHSKPLFQATTHKDIATSLQCSYKTIADTLHSSGSPSSSTKRRRNKNVTPEPLARPRLCPWWMHSCKHEWSCLRSRRYWQLMRGFIPEAKRVCHSTRSSSLIIRLPVLGWLK